MLIPVCFYCCFFDRLLMHLRERKPWSRSLWFASQCLYPGTWLEAIPFDGSMLCIWPLSLSSRPSHGPLLTRWFGSSKFSKLPETSKSPCYWSDFGARRCADFAMRMVSSRPIPDRRFDVGEFLVFTRRFPKSRDRNFTLELLATFITLPRSGRNITFIEGCTRAFWEL